MQVTGPSTGVPGAVVGSKPVFFCQYHFFFLFLSSANSAALIAGELVLGPDA